jgi:hypothetical protein
MFVIIYVERNKYKELKYILRFIKLYRVILKLYIPMYFHIIK